MLWYHYYTTTTGTVPTTCIFVVLVLPITPLTSEADISCLSVCPGMIYSTELFCSVFCVRKRPCPPPSTRPSRRRRCCAAQVSHDAGQLLPALGFESRGRVHEFTTVFTGAFPQTMRIPWPRTRALSRVWCARRRRWTPHDCWKTTGGGRCRKTASIAFPCVRKT